MNKNTTSFAAYERAVLAGKDVMPLTKIWDSKNKELRLAREEIEKLRSQIFSLRRQNKQFRKTIKAFEMKGLKVEVCKIGDEKFRRLSPLWKE